MKKNCLIWFVLGMVYITIEILWSNNTDRTMIFVGGLCGLLVGALNQLSFFYQLRVVWQSFIGAIIVLCVEYLSGCILNLWLNLDIWDYSNMFWNLHGQVCVLYGFLWLLLMPFAIWIEDSIQWWIYDWKIHFNKTSKIPSIKPYSIFDIYKDFFTGK